MTHLSVNSMYVEVIFILETRRKLINSRVYTRVFDFHTYTLPLKSLGSHQISLFSKEKYIVRGQGQKKGVGGPDAHLCKKTNISECEV